jgi:hypothetical protein
MGAAMSHEPSAQSSARTIVQEHLALRALLKRIEEAFTGPEPQLDSGVDVVAARLDSLRGPLWAHFEEEERAGLFEEIEGRAPEQAPLCARLRQEHRGLLSRLDALRLVPPEGRRGAGWAPAVRAFLHEYDEHEAREADLLARTLEVEGGAPD